MGQLISPQQGPTKRTHILQKNSKKKFFTNTQGSHRAGKSGNSGKILKTFSSQGNQGKRGVFSQNQGKNFEIRELLFQNHFQPFKHFNQRKKTFLSGEVLVLGSVSVIN